TSAEPASRVTAVAMLNSQAGSALVLLDRKLWLGAGALAVFLLLTILIVHTFWSKTGVEAKLAMFFALEHIAVIGGLIATAIASAQRQRLRQDVSVAATYQKA
ncbi:DoxX family protein, partial [Pseudomonas aeruginosa]